MRILLYVSWHFVPVLRLSAFAVARLVSADAPAHELRRRALGILKGRLKLPGSFFDPLSEEELQSVGWIERER